MIKTFEQFINESKSSMIKTKVDRVIAKYPETYGKFGEYLQTKLQETQDSGKDTFYYGMDEYTIPISELENIVVTKDQRDDWDEHTYGVIYSMIMDFIDSDFCNEVAAEDFLEEYSRAIN